MSAEAENGASTIRAGDFLDSTAIPATISLPAAVWERLTADLRDDDRDGFSRPELPDKPLNARIEMFLEMQLIAWEGSVTEEVPVNHTPGGPDGDLDDEVPF